MNFFFFYAGKVEIVRQVKILATSVALTFAQLLFVKDVNTSPFPRTVL